jgi:hypothetical protein
MLNKNKLVAGANQAPAQNQYSTTQTTPIRFEDMAVSGYHKNDLSTLMPVDRF